MNKSSKWTDGKFIRKLEKRLLKVINNDYESADGKLYVAIDSADVTFNNYRPTVTLYIRFGREETEYPFQKELAVTFSDGSLDFLAGQFEYATFCYDMYGIDGK